MQQQLRRALEYIEEHLTEPFTMEQVADAANFSLYHFHRLFSNTVHEPLAEYIRKRRLSHAAKELLFTKNHIKEIAIRYGFTSQEAFTRAFQRLYGVTPGKLRRNKVPAAFYLPFNTFYKGALQMKPRIEHIDDFTVAGLAVKTTMSENRIPQLWDQFIEHVSEIEQFGDGACPSYGVCFYDTASDYGSDSEFTYLAAMQVRADTVVPAPFTTRVVRGGNYAVFEHIGTLDTLTTTYQGIYSNWIKDAGLELDKRDDFEKYDFRFKYGEPDSVMEIWVPIK